MTTPQVTETPITRNGDRKVASTDDCRRCGATPMHDQSGDPRDWCECWDHTPGDGWMPAR